MLRDTLPILFYDRLMGRGTYQHIVKMEREQWLPPEVHLASQMESFRRLISHAKANVPYYRKLFQQLDLSPEDIKNPKDILSIPFLTKDIVRENFNDLVDETCPKQFLQLSSTGGSTGKPMKFYVDVRNSGLQSANVWHLYRVMGRQPLTKTLYISGNPIDYDLYFSLKQRIKNLLRRQKVFSAFSMDQQTLQLVVEYIRRDRPAFLIAYNSAVRLLASYVLEKGISLTIPAVIPTAELLVEQDREMFQRAFNCEVFNTYGAREAHQIAGECQAHEGMHISTAMFYVEAIAGGQPAVPAQPGEVIVTHLANYGMPLIRYRIGDVGTLAGKTCSCGRGLPLMNITHGRILNVITTADGKMLSGEFFPHLFKEVVGEVRQFQIVQRARDQLAIYIVPTEVFRDETRQYLLNKIRERVGPTMRVDFEIKAEIKQTASGKYQATLSEVPVSFE